MIKNEKMKKLNIENLATQGELYKVAKSQNTINQLLETDNSKEKKSLSIKINESNKTAIPLLISTFDKETNQSNKSSDPVETYKSANNIIQNHLSPKNEEAKKAIIKERFINVIENNNPEDVLKKYPVLKDFYKEIPKIEERAKSIPGTKNKERFVEKTKEKLVSNIVENINNKPIQAKENKDVER
jgi:hypothetical protein